MNEPELVVLLRTSRVAAEATAERLAERGHEVALGELPNGIVRLISGGSYRVEVLVPRAQVEAAREELARLEAEAGPRVAALAREVERGILLAVAGSLIAGGWLLAFGPGTVTGWLGVALGLAVGLVLRRRSDSARAQAGAPSRRARG